MTSESDIEEAKRVWPVGSKWLKTVSSRRFIITVEEDGFTESLEKSPADIWPGKWKAGLSEESKGYWTVLIELMVGDDHYSRLRPGPDGSLSGHEFTQDEWNDLRIFAKAGMERIGDEYPRVTLSRLD